MQRLGLKSCCKQLQPVRRFLHVAQACAKYVSHPDNPVPRDENVPNRQKLATWQYIQPKGRGFDKMLEYTQKDDTLISNPDRARELATRKLQSMKDQLTIRGFARETKAYKPPDNLDELFQKICAHVLRNGNLEQCLQMDLSDRNLKYNLIVECEREFAHELPNSELHLIQNVQAVYDFYGTEVRGVTSFGELIIEERQQKLPPNMHIVPEYVRYNPDDDTFFDKKDAFPKMPNYITGLKLSKKYENYKTPMEWPDI